MCRLLDWSFLLLPKFCGCRYGLVGVNLTSIEMFKDYRSSNASVIDTFYLSIALLVGIIFIIFPAKRWKRNRLYSQNKLWDLSQKLDVSLQSS